MNTNQLKNLQEAVRRRESANSIFIPILGKKLPSVVLNFETYEKLMNGEVVFAHKTSNLHKFINTISPSRDNLYFYIRKGVAGKMELVRILRLKHEPEHIEICVHSQRINKCSKVTLLRVMNRFLLEQLEVCKDMSSEWKIKSLRKASRAYDSAIKALDSSLQAYAAANLEGKLKEDKLYLSFSKWFKSTMSMIQDALVVVLKNEDIKDMTHEEWFISAHGMACMHIYLMAERLYEFLNHNYHMGAQIEYSRELKNLVDTFCMLRQLDGKKDLTVIGEGMLEWALMWDLHEEDNINV